MTFLEALAFLYIVLAAAGFTAALWYLAFCGIRQAWDDARTGARYRIEDEKFREAVRSRDSKEGTWTVDMQSSGK